MCRCDSVMKNKKNWVNENLQTGPRKGLDILNEDVQIAADYDRIHKVKSVLYAAIEQVGLNIERLASVQRLLRELFVVMNLIANGDISERVMGKQIVEELIARYGYLICCHSTPSN